MDLPGPRIAILAGPGSWSHETLHAALPSARAIFCTSADDAWSRVTTHRADGAWLPVWNSTIGRIRPADGIAAGATCVLSDEHRIQHALLGLPTARRERIQEVLGHAAALAQCRRTLARIVPQAIQDASIDAGHGALALRDSTCALVGNPGLVKRFRLRILQADVSDDPDNRTRFQLVTVAEGADALRQYVPEAALA